MNQKHLKSIFNANADVNFLIGNIIQNKNGIMLSANVRVKLE